MHTNQINLSHVTVRFTLVHFQFVGYQDIKTEPGKYVASSIAAYTSLRVGNVV